MLEEGQGLIAQMNSGGKGKVYAAFKVEEGAADELVVGSGSKLQALAEKYGGWDPIAREAIMACEEDSVRLWKIYNFSPDISWETELTGVTIIGEYQGIRFASVCSSVVAGDAAHVMSPFAGEGANQGKSPDAWRCRTFELK